MAFHAIHPQSAGPEVGQISDDKQPSKKKRISRLQLTALRNTMKEKELGILWNIRKYHFLTSGHIKRLHFKTSTTDAANLRAANKCMKHLRELGLVAPLIRRIGGFRAGSSALTWHLTEPGERLLWLDEPDKKHTRKRFEEPSADFLHQTLAVAEAAVFIISLAESKDGLSIRRLDTDFSYAVRYRDETVSIKPGLYTVLHCDGYEYHWFVETAPYWDVVRNLVHKAEKYCKVYQQGSFQGQVGVFPLTLFILPDNEQITKLEQTVKEQMPEYMRLFEFTTQDALENAICAEIGLAFSAHQSYACNARKAITGAKRRRNDAK